MYRTNSGGGAKREEFPSILGIGTLDIKCMQEMYLDTMRTFSSSPSLSPTSSESSISQLSPDTLSAYALSPLFSSTPNPTAAVATASAPQSQLQSQNGGHFYTSSDLPTSNETMLSRQDINIPQQHKKQQNATCTIWQKQHYLAAAALTQQNYQYQYQQQQQQKNEISTSLKMFAMLAACKNGNDNMQQNADSPVDAIMKDFACNGYVTDDSSFFHQQTTLPDTSTLYDNDHNSSYGSQSDLNFNINYGTNRNGNLNTDNKTVAAFSQHNLRDMQKNLWMLQLPTQSSYFSHSAISHAQQQHAATVAAAAATAAAAVNMAYNNQNNRKLQKRYGSTKFDKFSAVKHCVFCENNNEAEAVVKSHAVRDALGRVLCPKLRTYICPICKASGDEAHTVKYCPQKPIITMEDAVKAESLRQAKNSYYNKQGMNV